MTVDQYVREFRAGRRPFPDLIKALRAVEASGEAGRGEVEDGLAEAVDGGLLPNDLAITLRASLAIGRPAQSQDDALDPPTEPRRPAIAAGAPADQAPLPRLPGPVGAEAPGA
ncbi:MAG: hypothetical protein JO107_04835, partial [Hyphomicrobiales bacterium]|nr:hypothetical protein [Hyphomicrobiales bacterium]